MSGQAPKLADPYGDIVFGGSGGETDGPNFYDVLAKEEGEKASGVGQWLAFQAGAGIKAAADSVVRLGTLGYKAAASAASGLTGEGFGSGWEQARQKMLADTGTTDPGVMEVVQSLGEKWGFSDRGNRGIGKTTDELIQRRLGESAIIGQTVGSIAAFATGPGALVGKGGELAAKPLAGMAERWMARKAGKGVAGVSEAAKEGKVWEFLAQSPEWAKTAGLWEKMLAAGGRRTQDLVGVTAANIAQSYAMSPEQDRLRAAGLAAATSWMAIPTARVGQWIAGKVSSMGMNAEQARAVRDAYSKWETGALKTKELDDVIRASTSTLARGVAQFGIAPAFEGTAFMALNPDAWDLWDRSRAGDSEAAAQLQAMWLGSVFGVAATKYAVPAELAPMFKMIRPDLNSLNTYIEAEAIRQAAAQEVSFVPGMKRALTGKEPTGPGAETAQPSMDELRAASAEERFNPPQDPAKPAPFTLEQRIGELVDAAQTDLQARYGWASREVAPAMRASWEPALVEGSSDVEIRFGRDDKVTLTRDGGNVKIVMSPKIEGILADFGVQTDTTSDLRRLVSPTSVEIGGYEAKQRLDDLALLGAFRRLQGEMAYQSLGYKEVLPGVYANPENGRYYTMQLDGTSATKNPLDLKWTAVEDIQVTGDLEVPQYSSEATQVLSEWLTQKSSIAPDPLVDGVIAQAVAVAQNSSTPAAEQLRAFLEQVPIQVLTTRLRPGEDRILALDLASLASGNHNAQAMVNEMINQYSRPAAGPEAVAPDAPPAKPAPAKAGMADVVEARTAARPQPDLPRKEPENPSQSMGASPEGALAAMAQRALQSPKVKRGARQAADYLFGKRTDVLQRLVPDSDLPTKARAAISGRAPALRGEAKSLALPAEKALRRLGKKWQSQTTKDGDSEFLLSEELLDGLSAPKNADEAAAQKGWQATLLSLWNASRKAGVLRQEFDHKTGDVSWKPLDERSRGTTPFVRGKDLDEVLGTDQLRRGWFEELVRLNPEVTINSKDGERPINADDLEREFQASRKQLGESMQADGVEAVAAMELKRRFKSVPSKWRGYEVRETNPFKVLEDVIRRQSARIAEVEQFGQDIPENARMALREAGVSEEVEANLAKGGVTKATQEFIEKIPSMGSEELRADYVKYTKMFMQEVGGRQPTKVMRGLGMFRALESVARPFMTAKAWVYDVPELFTQSLSHAGWNRTVRALGAFAKNPKATVEWAERIGSIDRMMADAVFEESSNAWQKIANAVGTPGSIAELGKGAYFTALGEVMLKDWAAGKVELGRDTWIVRELLNYPEPQAKALLSGRADDALKGQFLREFQQLLSARTTTVEGSRFAADPNVNAMFRFVRWATARMGRTMRIAGLAIKAGREKGWSSPDARRQYWNLGRVLTGYTVGGAVGQALAYAITDAFKGENGFKRYWQEMSNYPAQTLGKAISGQLVGGPIAQLGLAMMNREDSRAWAKLSVLTTAAMSVAVAWEKLATGDVAGALYSAAAQYGLFPLKQEFNNAVGLAGAWILGRDANAESDAALIRSFKALEGIKDPYGQRNKPEQFYEALRATKRIAEAADSPAEAKKAVVEEIRTMLGLATEESVAAAIDAQQHTKGLTNQQMVKLSKMVGDDARMQRIYQHDAMISEVAKLARTMEGTYPTPWEAELSAVSVIAAQGNATRWRGLAERAVDEAMQRLLIGDGIGTQIDDLARSMAIYPEQMVNVFTPEQAQRIARQPDTLARARYMAAILRTRARDKRDRERDAAKKREKP